MNPELSAFQIVETCHSIKQQLRSLSSDGAKRIKYAIYYQNPSTGEGWQQYAVGNTRDNSLEQFDTSFDYATQHLKGAIRVRVVFSDAHGKTLADLYVPILSLTNTISAPQQVRPLHGVEEVETERVSKQEPQSSPMMNNINAMLGLLGFGGLGGADDSPEAAAFGRILQVRDGLKDAQFEQRMLADKYQKSLEECAQLKERVSGLESSLTEREKEIDRLQSQNDDLQDDIDDLQAELQKRETITGLGSIAIQKLAGNIIKRNPARVSKLLGISAQDMLGMIEGSEVEDTGGVGNDLPQVDVEDNSPRSTDLKTFVEWSKTLSDAEYGTLRTILQVFQSDKRAIEVTLNLMRQQTGGGDGEE